MPAVTHSDIENSIITSCATQVCSYCACLVLHLWMCAKPVWVADYNRREKKKTEAGWINEWWGKEVWGERSIWSVRKQGSTEIVQNELRWIATFSKMEKKSGEIFCTPWYLSTMALSYFFFSCSLLPSITCSRFPRASFPQAPALERYYWQVNLRAVPIEQHLPSCE